VIVDYLNNKHETTCHSSSNIYKLVQRIILGVQLIELGVTILGLSRVKSEGVGSLDLERRIKIKTLEGIRIKR
jgi:hypothetical protein